jgi:hypothetical protein
MLVDQRPWAYIEPCDVGKFATHLKPDALSGVV